MADLNLLERFMLMAEFYYLLLSLFLELFDFLLFDDDFLDTSSSRLGGFMLQVCCLFVLYNKWFFALGMP